MSVTVKDWLDGLSPSADDDVCILFPFSIGTHGYGQFQARKFSRKPVLAHRYICEKFRGAPSDPTIEAAHSCGNRRCVNRNHIRWATPAENQADRQTHGRDNRGERHGMSKLTLHEVTDIRNADGSHKDIAQQFGISRQTVGDIKGGRRWAHLN